MMHLELSRDVIRALLAIAPKNEPRAYLNGACIDADRQLAVVSDGVMLLAIRTRIIGSGRVTVRRDTLEQASKIILRPSTSASFDISSTSVAVFSGGARIEHAPIEDEFPPIDRILPRSLSGETAQFDPRKLTALGKAFELLADSRAPGLVIAHNGDAAAVVGHDSVPNAFALLMPYRASEIDLLARMRSLIETPATAQIA